MFPDFVDAKDVRHRWKPLLTTGGKENRSGPEGLGRPPDLTAPLPDNLTVPSVGAMNVWTALGPPSCNWKRSTSALAPRLHWAPGSATGAYAGGAAGADTGFSTWSC